ncbi:ferritin-like protein [Streptomyces sp. B1866]|uniref:ferritin-like domain-containing protein n=1 Tax=Streptomyces sp. B1866 TaxID=3075431 RepID=UPI0028905576|nr:ferritin-like protein [Streptomyces sp. B1866]MDT3397698.1 ferritin-like protein [Streptomyces sp. B1866]
MSYLEYPRLHFAGRFFTDPSTVNNEPEHYDIDTFEPRWQKRGAVRDSGQWNPRGGASFRLSDCTVTSVVRRDGTVVTSGDVDPIVGGSLVDDGHRVSAKLSDIDPQQQMSTTIWGLRLRLLDRMGRLARYGDFRPATFVDIWGRAPHRNGMTRASAMYQSVVRLRNEESAKSDSAFVTGDLAQATVGDSLSIKFTLDGYSVDWQSPNFTTGRIVGSIGLCGPDEPRQFVPARRLRMPGGAKPQYVYQGRPAEATCLLTEKRLLHVDLGNSMPCTSPGGPPVDFGALQVVLLQPGGGSLVVGQLDRFDDAFYRTFAGIATLRLSEEHAKLAARCRIGLRNKDGLLLAENDDATYARADDFVYRIYPNDPEEIELGPEVRIHATQYGKPLANARIAFPGGPQKEGETAPRGLQPIPPVTTDARGVARVRLTATDPKNPRGYIDGQFWPQLGYGRVYQPSAPQEGQAESPNEVVADDGALFVLVWNHYPYRKPEDTSWVSDVHPILQQYANLYPAMRDVVDLGSYRDVVTYRERLKHVFTVPVESPAYMPVTRDLSPGRRDAIVAWLNEPGDPPFARIRNADDLRRLLQIALELEHSTIPAYLCALFSLKPGRNPEVGRILRSVVMQEMLHMALVANVMNAVGGAPRIGRPGFVPVYPAHLPGGVLPDLMIHLRKCSKKQVREVFMGIEQPEEPLLPKAMAQDEVAPRLIHPHLLTVENGEITGYEDPDTRSVVGAETMREDVYEPMLQFYRKATYKKYTIAWLYQQVILGMDHLVKSGRNPFVDKPGLQLVDWPGGAPGNLIRVKDLKTATAAINEIIYQGEGAQGKPEYGGEPAHYYRFQQIVKGRELAEQDDGSWDFTGPEIPFEEDGVYPMVDDPVTQSLPADSLARSASERFNRVYGDLLQGLHRVFNGHPEELQGTVSQMYSVELRAKELFAFPAPEEKPAEPGPYTWDPDKKPVPDPAAVPAAGAQAVCGPSFQVPPAP